MKVKDKITIELNLWKNNIISDDVFYLAHNGLRHRIARKTGGSGIRRVVSEQLRDGRMIPVTKFLDNNTYDHNRNRVGIKIDLYGCEYVSYKLWDFVFQELTRAVFDRIPDKYLIAESIK